MQSDALSSSGPAPPRQGGVFALGNFDGVHLGHRAVIEAARDKALGLGAPTRVLTLEPHPRSVFKPGIAPFRLTPEPAKSRLLRACGADEVTILPFTPEFAQLPAPAFVAEILIGRYGARHVVAGVDFVFGHERGGTMPRLRQWLAPHGVGVTEVAPFRDAQGEALSSSRTREALRQGDPQTARRILGRPWSIAGVIVPGAALGRSMSVPTANIALGDYLRPQFGVYAVQAGRVGAATRHQGVANIGVRPTVDGKTELLEFNLFDFYEDIYGQEWEVELIDFIRPERAFADLDALRGQILRDIESAKARLARTY